MWLLAHLITHGITRSEAEKNTRKSRRRYQHHPVENNTLHYHKCLHIYLWTKYSLLYFYVIIFIWSHLPVQAFPCVRYFIFKLSTCTIIHLSLLLFSDYIFSLKRKLNARKYQIKYLLDLGKTWLKCNEVRKQLVIIIIIKTAQRQIRMWNSYLLSHQWKQVLVPVSCSCWFGTRWNRKPFHHVKVTTNRKGFTWVLEGMDPCQLNQSIFRQLKE